MAYKDPEKKRANARAWYIKNRETALQKSADALKTPRSKKWFREYNHDPKTWPKRACYQMKNKAKDLGIAFDIRPEDLQVPAVCPFTLLPFDFGPKNGKASPQSPSVDRIKPDRGYVRGNVRVISNHANMVKNSCTDPDVFQRLADDARLWGLV
jgi:hypothetical protein